MASYLRTYGIATTAGRHFRIPMLRAGTCDFATDAHWTPVAGDVKVSINGGPLANIAVLPSYVNGAWTFTLTQKEMTGWSVDVIVIDPAPKAVADQYFTIETFCPVK